MAKSKKSKAAILDDAPAENTVKIESAKNLKSTTNTDATPKKKSKRAVKKEIKAVIDDIDNVNSSFEEIADQDMNGEEDFVVTGGDGETTIEGLEEAPMIDILPLATDVMNPEEYEDNAFDEKIEKPDEAKNATEEDPSETAPPTEVKTTTDVRSSEDRTIFVKNLPFDTTVEELEALFSEAKEVRLLTKASGKCRGKAFVEMNTVEAAHKAHAYKKWDLRKKRLEVDLCGSKSNNTEADEIKETGTLSIKANTEFDEMDLEDLFEDPVQIRFPKNGLNIAYAQFESKEVAKKYKESDLEINGQQIVFSYVPDRLSAAPKGRRKGEKWERKKQDKAEAAIKANKEKRDQFKDRMTKRKNEGDEDESEEASPMKVFKSESSRGSFRGRGRALSEVAHLTVEASEEEEAIEAVEDHSEVAHLTEAAAEEVDEDHLEVDHQIVEEEDAVAEEAPSEVARQTEALAEEASAAAQEAVEKEEEAAAEVVEDLTEVVAVQAEGSVNREVLSTVTELNMFINYSKRIKKNVKNSQF
ncbi:unnamed protein product [Oikopleura dioica]|uniref:RRM domain-containing protein n=1 Tax=Oikopleura dioica TaxID=34765 RepID=E4WX76_OIKDI|nr:unnamed protein product [Oikopleura dioica]